jgi:hypothetical protein
VDLGPLLNDTQRVRPDDGTGRQVAHHKRSLHGAGYEASEPPGADRHEKVEKQSGLTVHAQHS